jgi:hypothetical protein
MVERAVELVICLSSVVCFHASVIVLSSDDDKLGRTSVERYIAKEL